MIPFDGANGFDEDEDELAPEQKSQIQSYLQQKYAAAGDTAELEEAQADKKRGDIGALIGQAVSNYGSARAASRGQNVRTSDAIFDAIRQRGSAGVADAKAARQDKMGQVLTEDEISQREKTRARQGVEQGRSDEQYERTRSLQAGEDDPGSDASKQAQALAEKLTGQAPGAFAGKSATALKSALPTMKDMWETEQRTKDRAQSRAESAADRAAARADAAAARQAAKDADHDWKEEQVGKANTEKKKTVLAEIEDRRTNINSNLDVLDKMIAEKGTWEVMGSHNQDIDRLVDQIATDMAKLQDPSSVARPSEVDAIKRNLISSGFGNKNSTARDIIKNFKEEVNKRADGAYDIRGLADLRPKRAPPPGAEGGDGEAIAAPAKFTPSYTPADKMSDDELDAELERLRGGP